MIVIEILREIVGALFFAFFVAVFLIFACFPTDNQNRDEGETSFSIQNDKDVLSDPVFTEEVSRLSKHKLFRGCRVSPQDINFFRSAREKMLRAVRETNEKGVARFSLQRYGSLVMRWVEQDLEDHFPEFNVKEVSRDIVDKEKGCVNVTYSFEYK